MRKVRAKKLRKQLLSMLGDKPLTARVWRHHKRAYIKGTS